MAAVMLGLTSLLLELERVGLSCVAIRQQEQRRGSLISHPQKDTHMK